MNTFDEQWVHSTPLTQAAYTSIPEITMSILQLILLINLLILMTKTVWFYKLSDNQTLVMVSSGTFFLAAPFIALAATSGFGYHYDEMLISVIQYSLLPLLLGCNLWAANVDKKLSKSPALYSWHKPVALSFSCLIVSVGAFFCVVTTPVIS